MIAPGSVPLWTAALAAGLGALLAVLLVRPIQTWFKDSLSRDGRPVPGGLAVTFAMAGATILTVSAMGWDGHDLKPLTAAAGALALAALTWTHAARTLSPLVIVAAETSIALIVCSAGIRPHLIEAVWLDTVLAVAFLVLVMTVCELLGRTDGTVTLFGLATTGSLAAVCYTLGHRSWGFLLLAAFGALAGFLWHNWFPATSGHGKYGFTPIALLIGAATLDVAAHAGQSVATATAWMLLVPFVGLLSTAASVIARMLGRYPVPPDYLTQALLACSFTVAQQALLVASLALITGRLGALTIVGAIPGQIILPVTVAILAGLAVALPFIQVSRKTGPPVLPESSLPRVFRATVSRRGLNTPSPFTRKGIASNMSIYDYLKVLRNRWLIIASMVLLGLGTAGFLTAQATPQYASSVMLFVSAPDTGNGNMAAAAAAYQSGLLSQQRVRSYAELLRSRPIAEQLGRDLGSTADPDDLRDRIVVEPVSDSMLLRVTVTDPDPARAGVMAQTLGDGFGRLVAELERPASPATSPIRVTMVGKPEIASQPVSPKPLQNLGLGLLTGLIVGIGLALLRETLDTSIRDVETAREVSGTPTLGVLRFDRTAPSRPLLSHIDPHSPRAEAYRALRTNLSFLNVDRPIKTVLVTSCQAGDGKSSTASNLALSLVEAGAKVALIEADLRRPRLADYLGIEGAVGLTSILIGQATLSDVLQPWGYDGLLVLPSGPLPPNPSELLGSQQMQTVIASIAELADIVIIDAPPVLPVTDAAVLSRMCDGVLLVVRHAKSTRDQLLQAVQQLESVGARLLGHVLSMAPATRSSSYGYGSVYAQRQASREKATVTSSH